MDNDLIALYERTVADLYRYASRLTGGDRPAADELVQETYLSVLRRIRGGQQESVDIGWLIVNCRRLFLDQLKHDQRRRARERRAASDRQLVEFGGRAVDALAELPGDHRVALVLRYVDDMAVPDVARTMGRSVHATESLLARARASLRSALPKE